MSQRAIVIYVPKQGIEHFEAMLAWLRTHVSNGKFQWFGYNIGAYKDHDVIHF